jgi:hypothetical protein
LSTPVHLLDRPNVLPNDWNKFFLGCRGPDIFTFFAQNSAPQKRVSNFRRMTNSKKVQLFVFLGVWVNFDGSLCFRRILPRALNSYFYYILRTIRKILSLNLFWPNLYKQRGIELH